MAKCGGCGQFIAASAGIRCSKCTGCFHRACVGVPAAATPAPGWLCPGCKAKLPKTDNSATPVKSAAADFTETNSPPTDTTASLDLAREIRSFREELSALRAEIRDMRQETADFRAAIGGCNERMDEVEHRVTNLEQRFEAREMAGDREESCIGHQHKYGRLNVTTTALPRAKRQRRSLQ